MLVSLVGMIGMIGAVSAVQGQEEAIILFPDNDHQGHQANQSDQDNQDRQGDLVADFGLAADAVTPTTDAVVAAREPQRMVYGGAPVVVTMTANRERRIVFDAGFQIGVDPSVSEAFYPEVYGRNLLLTVSRPLQTRMQVQLEDGQVIPVDIHVVNAGVSHHPVEIVRQSVLDAARGSEQVEARIPQSALHQGNGGGSRSGRGGSGSIGYTDLVRFAAQNLYAPQRLVKPLRGVAGVDVVQRPIRLMRFDQVETRPIASWRVQGGRFGQVGQPGGRGWYVTAVEVKNKRSGPIHLDPRMILGRFRAATFHHRRLLAKGSGYDTTVLYLISGVSFAQALGLPVVQPFRGNSQGDSGVRKRYGRGVQTGRGIDGGRGNAGIDKLGGSNGA